MGWRALSTERIIVKEGKAMTQELKSTVERNAEKAENLSFCSGIKLLHIRKNVQELLSFIGKGGIFEEYTVHSIDHVDEMLKIIEWLIPKETQDAMTKAEWLMLTLAVYFHDLGMVVTRDEYNNRNNSSFRAYKNSILSGDSSSEYKEYARNNDRFLYQEFVRENHAKRIKLWIEGKEDIQFGDAESVRTEISNMLANLDNMFKTDLAKICESHHKDDIEDFSKYKIKVHYGNDDEEIVNLNYIAIILRIADLLHITKDRTPSIARRIINVSNPVSVLEWEKQKAVRAVQPQPRRNAEGNIDDTLEKNTIEITAYFDGAENCRGLFRPVRISAVHEARAGEMLRHRSQGTKKPKARSAINSPGTRLTKARLPPWALNRKSCNSPSPRKIFCSCWWVTPFITIPPLW